MLKIDKFIKYLLFFVLLLSFVLRFYKFTQIPPSLNWDETSIAYNAYSVLKTGHDEWGKFLPLHFLSFGEYKLPMQIYASIPGIFIFGLNEIGVRVTPLIYGTLTVFLLYLLVFELFKNKPIALISSFFLGISPWHIQLTRASFESSFSLFWIVLGIWFLIKGLSIKNKKWIVFSMIPFVISVYTYNSARVFTPLFLFVFAIVNFRYFWKIKYTFLFAGILFFVLLIPLIPFVISGEASARYKLVSITDDPGLIPRIEERRNNSDLPLVITKLIHNRYSYNLFYFAQNYLSHFTFDFLFINGAGHRQHHVQGVGELYLIQAPFIVYGFYLLLKNKNKVLKLLTLWLFISLIPVSMTNDSIPNALRTLIANPVYQVLTGVGIYYFLLNFQNKKLKKFVIMFSILVLIVNFAVFTKKLFIEYSSNYSRDWQYGYKQAVNFIDKNYDNYDLIVFTRHYGEPHIFTLFYLKYPPQKFYQDSNLERFETFDWVRVLKFDKFYFPDLGDWGTKYNDIVKENEGKKILFIGKPGDFPKGKKILEDIYFLNGSKVFEIADNL